MCVYTYICIHTLTSNGILCVCVLVTQLCLTLCGTMDYSLPGSSPLSMGILQARILEWDAMLSSRGSSQPRDQPRSPALQVDSLPTETLGSPNEILLSHKNEANPDICDTTDGP